MPGATWDAARMVILAIDTPSTVYAVPTYSCDGDTRLKGGVVLWRDHDTGLKYADEYTVTTQHDP